jgi:hypothetical protein
LLVAAGCSSSPTIQLSNYSTGCMTAADCAVVFVGDPCASLCKCDNAAISTADVARQAADLHAAEGACGPTETPCTASCDLPTATCADGKCALQ